MNPMAETRDPSSYTDFDELMERLAIQYPGYGWEVNKGYPTKAHRAAIATLGPTPLHRRSFRLT